MNDDGAGVCPNVACTSATHGVTWLHSYVGEDKTGTFHADDGPSPEAIREAATPNGLPVDTVGKVNVLNPYFYR